MYRKLNNDLYSRRQSSILLNPVVLLFQANEADHVEDDDEEDDDGVSSESESELEERGERPLINSTFTAVNAQ